MSLSDSVMYLGGVGPKRAELLKKLDIHTVYYCEERGDVR